MIIIDNISRVSSYEQKQQPVTQYRWAQCARSLQLLLVELAKLLFLGKEKGK